MPAQMGQAALLGLVKKDRKRSINPARQDGIYFQEAGAEAGEQFQGSSAS